MKNEMLALILAGGQGTRLGKLTQSIVIVLLTLPYPTVPTQVSTMLA